jgi:putative spermidine/putrescine transport system permease protein
MKFFNNSHVAIYGALNAAVVLFLILPLVVVVVFAFGDSNAMAFPPKAMTLKWFLLFWHSSEMIRAMLLSLQIAAVTMIFATLFGASAAYALVRTKMMFSDGLTQLFMSPLILPAILTGLALFQVLVLLDQGRPLWVLVMGHTLVTIPYVIRSVGAVLQRSNREIEEAARVLGANSVRVFFEVTLPSMRSGLASGGVFAFVVSFDQLPISLFLVAPNGETLPIVLFNTIRFNLDGTLAAASVVSIAFASLLVAFAGKLGAFKNL